MKKAYYFKSLKTGLVYQADKVKDYSDMFITATLHKKNYEVLLAKDEIKLSYNLEDLIDGYEIIVGDKHYTLDYKGMLDKTLELLKNKEEFKCYGFNYIPDGMIYALERKRDNHKVFRLFVREIKK